MVYQSTTIYGGETKTVTGNWAGIVYAIYSQITDEEDARRASSLVGPIQAEMFFEQDVDLELRDPKDKFRIKIKRVKSQDEKGSLPTVY